MKPIREKDGRFKPRTGLTLPPKKKQPKDEYGQFIAADKVKSSKPYSTAVRQLMVNREGGLPEGWDHENLTEAQSLAMVHMAQAKGGNVQVGLMLVDRAEGKVPQAAEDREATLKAGEGVRALASLLGIDMLKVIDVEVEDKEELDALSLLLPEGTHGTASQGDSAPAPEGAGDVDRAGEPAGEPGVEEAPVLRVEGVSGGRCLEWQQYGNCGDGCVPVYGSSEDDDFAEWLRSGSEPEGEADGTVPGAEAEPGKAAGSAD
jgi:hypothetical protein